MTGPGPIDMAVRSGEAFRALAPDHNVSGWLAEIGAEAGVSERQMWNLYYGKNAPALDNFHKFIGNEKLGAKYANLVLAGSGVRCTDGQPGELVRPTSTQHASTLRAIADLIEKEGGK